MPIVAKPTAPSDAVEFLCRPMCLGVRAIGGIAGLNRQWDGALTVDVSEDLIGGQGGEKGGLGLGQSRRGILEGV